MTPRKSTLFLLMFFASAAPVWAQASLGKLDKSLRASVESGCTGKKSVIIRTQSGYREGLRKSLAAHGDVVSGEFPALDAIVVDVHCQDLKKLAESTSTRSISDNASIRAHQLLSTEPVSTDPIIEQPIAEETLVDSYSATRMSSTGLLNSSSQVTRLIEALSAQELQTNFFSTLAVRSSGSTSGQGIGVGVIDSGIEAGIDFDSRITAFYDFTSGDIRATKPSDPYGHGSHVAGLIAGTYVGVAPATRLVGLRVLDGAGRGTTASVIRAIEFAIASKSILNIQVLNLSLGHPIYESAATDPLVQAVEHAVRSGLTVVVSAGNFGTNRTTGKVGYAGIASPGNAPSGISVGSVRTLDTIAREDDRIAPYSSRGPSWYDGFAKPDLSAPGDDLLSVAAVGSALRKVQEQRGNVGNYMRLSGTSMAAAVTSGMVALVLQANQGLTPNALKMVLQYSSIPVKSDTGGYADALTQGAGQIGGGAMTLARAIDSTAPLGSGWLTASIIPTSTIGGVDYTWSQRMIWGNHIARGSGVIDEQRPGWALNIVWGEGLEDDDNIVWGNLDDDNIVWGNALDQDDNIVWGNNLVWGNSQEDDDNIVWGNLDDDNIVWGNFDDDNIVWGNNVVWGNSLVGMSLDDDNIVWGNFNDDNIVWGNLDDDNIVWGNLNDDNIVWGNSVNDIAWSDKAFGKIVTKSSSTSAKGVR
jgi:serine protease AprX